MGKSNTYTKSFRRELDRCYEEIMSGTAVLLSYEEVMEGIKEIIAGKRKTLRILKTQSQTSKTTNRIYGC